MDIILKFPFGGLYLCDSDRQVLYDYFTIFMIVDCSLSRFWVLVAPSYTWRCSVIVRAFILEPSDVFGFHFLCLHELFALIPFILVILNSLLCSFLLDLFLVSESTQ